MRVLDMTLHKNFYNQHKKINENNVFFMSKGRIYLVLLTMPAYLNSRKNSIQMYMQMHQKISKHHLILANRIVI